MNHMIDLEIQYSDWNAKKTHKTTVLSTVSASVLQVNENIDTKWWRLPEEERENSTKQIASADSKWKL